MAIMGSPRKGSNVDILIDKVVEGVKIKTAVDLEKIYLYESDIKYCTGCGAHSILQGSKDCPLGDAMDGILKRMQQADALIFGSPNHGRTISAGLTNFFSKMMSLLKMHVERDGKGNIIHAETKPLIRGKKAVIVVSQGDFSASSSALLLMVLNANLRDFHLRKVGEVFSTGNLKRAQVKKRKLILALHLRQVRGWQ